MIAFHNHLVRPLADSCANCLIGGRTRPIISYASYIIATPAQNLRRLPHGRRSAVTFSPRDYHNAQRVKNVYYT